MLKEVALGKGCSEPLGEDSDVINPDKTTSGRVGRSEIIMGGSDGVSERLIVALGSIAVGNGLTSEHLFA